MSRAKAVNIKHSDYDVLIMRGTKWGNPIRISDVGSREECLMEYKKHLIHMIKTKQLTREDFKELEGKRLGCCCKPLNCHGDILADVVNKLFEPNLNFLFKD